nr:hypothetical protein GCM10020185_00940 [Pseudomonas brassicacearum subsp. brassicacearum]
MAGTGSATRRGVHHPENLGRGWYHAFTKKSPTAQDNLQLSAEQAKSLGIAGDTPRDTVATLVGQVKAMRSDMLGLKKTQRFAAGGE